jgi:hypothetical protein
MELKVIWTDPAIEDLRQIRNDIAEDNPSAAVSFGMELFRTHVTSEASRGLVVCSSRPKKALSANCFTVVTESFIKNTMVLLKSCICVMVRAETQSFDPFLGD